MKLGKIQTLRIVRFRDFGAYLAESDAPDADSVLLPKKQLPEGVKEGDELTVFLYKDSAGRPIATTKKPLLTVGETGKLTIREITQIGAFLDIGLERDVLLPFRGRAFWLRSMWTTADVLRRPCASIRISGRRSRITRMMLCGAQCMRFAKWESLWRWTTVTSD